MDDSLILKNKLREIRLEQNMSQLELAKLVGVSRNTISSIETGQFNPTAKLALIYVSLSIKNLRNCFILNKVGASPSSLINNLPINFIHLHLLKTPDFTL